AGGGAPPLHPAPTRRAAGLRPCTPRLRGGRQGSALHPLGLPPQTPEMLTHLFSPADGTGVLGFCPSFTPSAPARQNGGGLGRFGLLRWVVIRLPLSRTKIRWHDSASGFS
ncbi:hypothetical protein D7X33_13620, partial [Butyricicoccus sp. 1XD8-22]